MQTRAWFEKHSVSVTAFLVVAMTHIDVVTILNARVFGAFDKGSLFNAPFSEATLKQLSWFGLVGNFLEDIPQLGIQVVCSCVFSRSWLILQGGSCTELLWFGLVGNFLEDIPQLGIQMVCTCAF